MKLMIAYDGSECADAALNDLVNAGLPTTGEAVVMTVTELFLPPPPPSSLEILGMATTVRGALGLERKYMAASPAVDQADEMAADAAVRFRSKFPNWEVRHEAAWGSPNWELIRKAEEWGADLIVAGSHGRSALGRLLLGSTSQWLVNKAHCSVRVARTRVGESGPPLRLLVGLDGSANSEMALEQILARNWPDKSEVRLVTVHQALNSTYPGETLEPLKKSVESLFKKEHTRQQMYVDKAARKLSVAGLCATGYVIDGDANRVLVKTAEEWRADCVFIGATGLTNRVQRFLLGSTAGAVAARAHCSVEIVRK